MARELGDRRLAALCLAELAWVAVNGASEVGARKAALRAATLSGTVEALLHSVNSHMRLVDCDPYEQTLAAAGQQVEPQAWEAARLQGVRMTLEQATEYAVAAVPDRGPAIPAR
jgi:hypothetical protein